MSRKWERMVEKNRKKANRIRMKQGKAPIAESPREQMDVYLGRSWFLPALFVSCSLFFGIVSFQFYETDTLFWLTVVAYFALGVLYFLRRPYIKIGRDRLSTRRLGVEKFISAGEIESIAVQAGSIVIRLKGKRTQWVLSKFQNLYDIPAIAARLKQFAEQNGIEYRNDAA